MPSLSNSLVSFSASTSSCTSVFRSGDAPTSPPPSSSHSYSNTGSGSASSSAANSVESPSVLKCHHFRIFSFISRFFLFDV